MTRAVAGRTITEALDTLEVEGDESITILDVRSIGGSEGARYLGFRVVGEDRKVIDQYQYNAFPPTEKMIGTAHLSGKGTVVPPSSETQQGMGYKLLNGYKILKQDLAERTSYEILYELRGVVYQQRMPNTLVFCPQSMEEKDCIPND